MNFVKIIFKSAGLCAVVIFAFARLSVAQTKNQRNDPKAGLNSSGQDVSFETAPIHKTAFFKADEKIVYDVKVTNPGQAESGKLSYVISTNNEKELNRGAIDINLGQNSKSSYTLTMPSQNAGFYKVKIIISVPDYDDTIRKVFGVDPKDIRSASKKPADFDQFWDQAKEELSKVDPEFKVQEWPDLEKQNTDVYFIEAKSLNNLKITGWLTLPKDRRAKEKFPVYLVFPGYGINGLKPIYGATEVAILCWNVRGQGDSREFLHPTRDGYLTTDLDNKGKYIYRGVLMDCIRAVDFIFTRPELDASKIICAGSSAGGYLSIATSSLDSRIKLCAATNPVFCDFRSLVGSKDWPMTDIERYTKSKYMKMDRILNTLDYYDLKNFSAGLKCKSLLAISLLDNLAPPYNEYTMINNISPKAKYKLFIYPDLGHEVPMPLFNTLTQWMADEFSLYY